MAKSMREFIREHAVELREIIRAKVPNCGGLDEGDLRLWVLNDKDFYRWAQSEGVEV